MTTLADPISTLIGQGSPAPEADPLARITQGRALAVFLAGCVGVFALLTGLLALDRQPGEPWGGWLPPLLAGLIALGALLALAQPSRVLRSRAPWLTVALLVLMMLLPVVVSGSRHLGLRGSHLALMSLVVAFTTGMLGRRTGLVFALGGTLALLALSVAERLSGWTPSTGTGESLGVRLVIHLCMLGLGLIVGLGLHRILRKALADGHERMAQFQGLLQMAVDWYWEMDQHFRFTHIVEMTAGISGLGGSERIGHTPWQIDIGLTDEDLDAHRADLESHRPFRGMLARRADENGQPRWVSISGEPRFDAQGNFRGYWGTGRDVTREVAAEQSVQATEARYRELFRRSPSPLVVHRWGRVLDANPAAMAMFGYTQRSGMEGQDLFSHYEPGDDETARRQADRLESQPPGAMQPMQEFRLLTLSRRRRLVQATSVRVEVASGPATLTFFTDQTEAARAQEALRRSEGLLSHLFETSPDPITLTELDTGRYTLVNKAFEDFSGYTASEIVGRTALDIGIWHNPVERDGLMAELRAAGHVRSRAVIFKRKSGELMTMQISLAPFTMDGTHYLVLFARDVTQNELDRLVHAAVLENASVAISLTREHQFRLANPHAERMFGWPAGTLIGQHSSVVWPSLDAWKASTTVIGPKLKAGELVDAEFEMRRRDGSTFLARLMARALDPNHASRGGTIWIMEDITERRRTEQALAQAKDDAQAASRAKSAFLANTSHEIRTPLNGLLGLGRLAQRKDLPEAQRCEYLDQMVASAESLSGLISDILDLSKIEAGRLTLESQPFSLRELLATMQTAYLPLAQNRSLLLELQVDEAVPAWVFGDPLRTRQILANFLSNALKFTIEGCIRIRAERLPQRGETEYLRISVQDTGPGIPTEQQARLFQPFTQLDESITRRYGGTGLGLSICRELAQLMGGDVGLSSSAGEGATFWADLPFPTAPSPALAPPRERADDDILKGRRVLMVEDHAVNMLIAAAQLEQWGLEVAQASDGAQAIEAVRAAASTGRPFDIILMDVHMPVMGGHEATRELRRDFAAAQLPIIALTAAALVSERDDALAAGMNDFLTKPLDPPKLRQALLRLLSPTEAPTP